MPNLDDDLDALFKLPLAEFIAARKTLAARLKKSGSSTEAERVKSLAKPPVSAWTVNQLYWYHREPFDELLASGQRFRKAQASGKVPLMRDALDARREALAQLSESATALLSEAGNNPSVEMIRRITSTLEALSAYAALPDGATLGRLTRDIDPPGFESLAGFTAPTRRTPDSVLRTKSSAPPRSTDSKVQSSNREEQNTKRQAELAAAKISVQHAKKFLTDAQAKVQSLESQQKKADVRAKDAEKQKREAERESREAEVRLKKASSAAEDAAGRAQTLRDELEEAKESLTAAQRLVERSTRELESLFRSTKNFHTKRH